MYLTMKNNVAAFIAGSIFAAGLGLSGMTMPSKVIGFLSISHNWDPSLALVMIGAILVHAVAWHFWLKEAKKPLFVPSFSVPTNKKIDRRLLTGASLFGVGWGLGGFCPGPAIVSAMSFDKSVMVFLLSMIAGMTIFHFYEINRQKRAYLDHSQHKSH